MPNLPIDISPFLVKTTAIMTAVIILTLIGAVLVSIEKQINRKTIEKFILTIRYSILALVFYEVILTAADFYLKLKG